MVHQHFMLIPVFTVTENVMLGHEDTTPGRVPGPPPRPARGGGDLPALRPRGAPGRPGRGPARRCAAARRDSQGAQPRCQTARPRRADRGPHPAGDRRTHRRSCAPLREAGTSIVFISHKLHEVRAVADTHHGHPPRRGRRLGGPGHPGERTRRDDGRAGRCNSPSTRRRRRPARSSSTSRDLTVTDHNGVVHVDHISLSVRGGEIFAVAGVQGNGQTEFTEALVGLDEPAQRDDRESPVSR